MYVYCISIFQTVNQMYTDLANESRMGRSLVQIGKRGRSVSLSLGLNGLPTAVVKSDLYD